MSEPTAENYAKIQAGAAMYLEVLRDRPDKTEDFLSTLRIRLGWSPSEIAALHARVAGLLQEASQEAAIAKTDPAAPQMLAP